MATSNETTMKVAIEPLNGSNYHSWKFNVKCLLMERGLWGIVSGTETAPVATETDKKETVIKDFLLRSQKAYSQIALNVKQEFQVHVTNTDDPKVAWETLKKHFEVVSVTHIVRVTRAFYASKMAEDGNLMHHITHMTQLAEQLREMKEEVSPKKFAVVVLGSLPESYETFLTSLNARSAEELSWDDVKPALIEEYTKKKDKQEKQNTDDALFTRGGNRSSNQNGGNRSASTFRPPNNDQNRNDNRNSSNQNRYDNRQQNPSNQFNSFNSRRGGGSGNNRGGSSRNKTCWGCGGYGHVISDCQRNKEEGNVVQEQENERVHKRIKSEDDDIALMVTGDSDSDSNEECNVPDMNNDEVLALYLIEGIS